MTDTTTSPIVFTDNPLNPLEAALYEGLADPAQMGVFERLVLEADLYAVPEAGSIGGVHGDDGAKVLREGENLVLRGVVLNDGRETVTLFTDPRRAVQMFGEDTRIIAMGGRALFNMLRNAVVLLNPADGKGLVLAPDQIADLLTHPEPAPAATRPSGEVQLSAVRELERPVVLIDALNRAFATLDVDAAWLARAHWNGGQQTGWYLDVRTTRPDDEVRAILTRAVRTLPFGADVFDIAIGRPGGADGVGVRVV